MFDVDKLAEYAQSEIEKFAASHTDETFYAFSIDADLLCLNSEEKFRESLKTYQTKYPQHYESEEQIKELKYNTGDWAYQGFADFSEDNGFDPDAYEEHYGMSDDEQKTSEYGMAMDAVVALLVERNAFGCLKKSSDFIANRVEHEY